MFRIRAIAWMAAIVASAGAYSLTPVLAVEDAPQAQSAGEASAPAKEGATSAPAPRSPIRIKTVDYQDAAEGAGKLKLAGTAAPGTIVYIFVDQQPYAKVEADGDGDWTVEGELQLDAERHMLRAEQYDPATRMLAGRAMVTIGRSKESP